MNKDLQISFVGYGYVPTQRDYNQSFRVDLRIGQDLPLDLTIGSYVKFQTIDIQLRHLKDGIFQVTDIVGRRLLLQLRSFSSTVSEDNYIGLDDYLVGEGMAKRLVPFKDNSGTQFRVNELMFQNLMTSPQEPSKTPSQGFLYRSYNNPDIFFDQVTMNIVQNYRSQYLTLVYALYDKEPQRAGAVLDRMEQVFPRKLLAIDYRIEHDAAMMYNRIGNIQKFNELSAEVEKQALDDLRKNPTDISSPWNPYKLLLDIYEARGDYQNALDVLSKLDKISPNSPEVKMKMETLRQQMQGIK